MFGTSQGSAWANREDLQEHHRKGEFWSVDHNVTAREIFRRKPSVKRALWGGEFWTDGYYVATVGEGGGWEVIERYVRNQGRTKEELRQLKLF